MLKLWPIIWYSQTVISKQKPQLIGKIYSKRYSVTFTIIKNTSTRLTTAALHPLHPRHLIPLYWGRGMLLQTRRAGQDWLTRQVCEANDSRCFRWGLRKTKSKNTQFHHDILRRVGRILVMRSREHVTDEPMVSQQISDIKTQRREGRTTRIQKIYLKTCICNGF